MPGRPVLINTQHFINTQGIVRAMVPDDSHCEQLAERERMCKEEADGEPSAADDGAALNCSFNLCSFLLARLWLCAHMSPSPT